MYRKLRSLIRKLTPSEETKIIWRTVWRADRGWTIWLLLLVAIASAASIASLVIIGFAAAAVPAAVRSGPASPEARLLFQRMVLFGVISLVNAAAGRFTGLARQRLQTKVSRDAEQRLLAVSLRPEGITHLESPAFADEITLIRGEMNHVWVGSVVGGLASTLQQRLTAAPAALIVASFAWWAPVLLLFSAVVLWRFMKKLMINLYKGWVRDASHLRRASYLRDLSLTAPASKEVRVFGMTGWITSSFRSAWLESMTAIWKERWALKGRIFLVSAIVGGSLAVVIADAARATLRGEIGLATLLILVQAALSVLGAGGYGNDQVFAWAAAAALVRIERLESHETLTASALQSGNVPVSHAVPERSIAFKQVRFAYPGSDGGRPVFEDLTLDIEAGSSVAIVGENGAGKTTLVKLLARLYDVDGGAIEIDGTDLRQFDLEAWRARVAVIFQDFARYEISLRDNVAFGRIQSAGDEESISNALHAAQASNLVENLPMGLDTILSPGYEGGADLSGGEWQKVGLARALLAAADGGLLILDEPTANLDVRAEAELFNRFLELTRGKTTILISHRFSSVRRARRIVVIDAGRIVEDGSHDDLMALNGIYARMYSLQAQQFVDQEETADV